MPLTELKVRNGNGNGKAAAKPVKMTDGNGMQLLITPNGSKYWRFQYRFGSKQKILALGVYPEVTLSEARRRREGARQLVVNRVVPGEKRKADKVEIKVMLTP